MDERMRPLSREDQDYLFTTQAEAIEEARKAIEGTIKGMFRGSVSRGTGLYGPVGN